MLYPKFIYDFRSLSLVDFPGKLAFMIYTSGCNMNCEFCFSKHLIPLKEGNFTWEQVLEEIKRNRFLESVVWSGGEPTIHNISKPIQDCLELGLKVGLQTNGAGKFYLDCVPLVDYILLSKYNPKIVDETMNLVKKDCIVNLIDVLVD
jgi:pyruvate formate lyase activating enzyme